MSRIAFIIPTYNGKSDLIRLLNSLERQNIQFDTLIVDSGSNDGTQEIARKRSDRFTLIKNAEFNHGGTRQMMVENNHGYDLYVYLTQDACLLDSEAIQSIIEPFADQKVGAVCGRQLPHLDATPIAQHARIFNYPECVEIKTMQDVPRMGIKTAFMSNSFAAYRKEALQAVGGFPAHVIFAEDMYVTAKMLLAGWKIVYAGNAQCRHSHNYSIFEEFRRYFDMGVFHAREKWIRENFGGAGGEGMHYVKSELRFLGLKRIYLWPSSIIRNAVKLFGYKIGQQESLIPISIKRKIGMHRKYWDGPYAKIKDC